MGSKQQSHDARLASLENDVRKLMAENSELRGKVVTLEQTVNTKLDTIIEGIKVSVEGSTNIISMLAEIKQDKKGYFDN